MTTNSVSSRPANTDPARLSGAQENQQADTDDYKRPSRLQRLINPQPGRQAQQIMVDWNKSITQVNNQLDGIKSALVRLKSDLEALESGVRSSIQIHEIINTTGAAIESASAFHSNLSKIQDGISKLDTNSLPPEAVSKIDEIVRRFQETISLGCLSSTQPEIVEIQPSPKNNRTRGSQNEGREAVDEKKAMKPKKIISEREDKKIKMEKEKAEKEKAEKEKAEKEKAEKEKAEKEKAEKEKAKKEKAEKEKAKKEKAEKEKAKKEKAEPAVNLGKDNKNIKNYDEAESSILVSGGSNDKDSSLKGLERSNSSNEAGEGDSSSDEIIKDSDKFKVPPQDGGDSSIVV